MTRQEIINELRGYFSIEDLVCNHTYAKHGEKSWMFLRTEALHCLLIIRRDILQVPCFINSEAQHQRGLRCNLCPLVKSKTSSNKLYLSPHPLGGGFDVTVKGMTADEARKKIEEKQDLLPYPIRFEAGVTWVHFDVYDLMNGKQINYFNP